MHQIDSITITAMTKRTLEMMTRKKISFYWENYLVWFSHFLGVNKDLDADIDRITNGGGQFSEKIHLDLYTKHYGKDNRYQSVKDTQRGIQKLLKDVLDEILHTQNFTSDYRDKLKGFTTQLNNAKDLDEIHKVVADLMLVTVSVIKSSEELKERLDETTRKSEKLQKDLEESQQENLIDPLTQLHNRKAFDRQISTFLKAFQEERAAFSLVVIDIDFFKKFNDKHGHLLGDQILKYLGSLLSQEVKGKDFVARYGGEEFVILLAGTSLEKACLVADNIRKKLASAQLKYLKTGTTLDKITMSAGVSSARDGDTEESLIKRADDAMYLAKLCGRNNIKSEMSERVAPSAVEFLNR